MECKVRAQDTGTGTRVLVQQASAILMEDE